MKRPKKKTHLADIARFVFWDPDIGLEQSHFFGFHGSGKSNLAHMILSYCLDLDEMGLMRGSMNCEWRHFLLYNYPVLMLVPEQLEPFEDTMTCLDFPGESLAGVRSKYPSFDYKPFNFETDDVINELIPGGLLVIYDEPFTLAARGWFWAKLFKKLKYRIEKHTTPVAYVEHEAGILYPEIALSESKRARSHWLAVNEVCELFVDFRKNFIRTILISQLESEINHRIRGKCIYKIIKKAEVSGKYHEAIRLEAPQQLVNQFISVMGYQSFIRWNESPEFGEIKDIWKQVPGEEYQDLELYVDKPVPEDEEVNLDTEVLSRLLAGWTEVATGDDLGLTRNQVHGIKLKYTGKF